MTTLWIGDSHTEVGGSRNLGYWVPRLWPEEPLAVVGHRGWSTARWVSSGELPGLVARVKPAIVVVALGGNDRASSPEVWGRSADALLEQVREAGARAGVSPRVVWVGPAHATDPEVGALHDRTAEQQRVVLRARNIPWVDSRPFTRTGHAGDGVHFTATGYEAWAKGLVEGLSRPRAAAQGLGTAVAFLGGALVVGAALWGAWRLR